MGVKVWNHATVHTEIGIKLHQVVKINRFDIDSIIFVCFLRVMDNIFSLGGADATSPLPPPVTKA